MPQLSANATFSGTTRWVLIAILVIILLVAVWAIRGILLLTISICHPRRSLYHADLLSDAARNATWSRDHFINLASTTFLVIGLAATALPELLNQFTQLATRNIPQVIEHSWNVI